MRDPVYMVVPISPHEVKACCGVLFYL